jgi:hypothetical protein
LLRRYNRGSKACKKPFLVGDFVVGDNGFNESNHAKQ